MLCGNIRFDSLSEKQPCGSTCDKSVAHIPMGRGMADQATWRTSRVGAVMSRRDAEQWGTAQGCYAKACSSSRLPPKIWNTVALSPEAAPNSAVRVSTLVEDPGSWSRPPNIRSNLVVIWPQRLEAWSKARLGGTRPCCGVQSAPNVVAETSETSSSPPRSWPKRPQASSNLPRAGSKPPRSRPQMSRG